MVHVSRPSHAARGGFGGSRVADWMSPRANAVSYSERGWSWRSAGPQRSLFDGAARIFGLTVGAFVRIIPRVWTTSYRGVGIVTVGDTQDGSRDLDISDMHPEMCSRPGYVILLRGLFRGMYRLAGDASEDFELHFNAESRSLKATFRWS